MSKSRLKVAVAAAMTVSTALYAADVVGAIALAGVATTSLASLALRAKLNHQKPLVKKNTGTAKKEAPSIVAVKPEVEKKPEDGYLYLGVSKITGENVYLDVLSSNTKSVIIKGSSGGGKTYSMLGLMGQLASFTGRGGVMIDVKPSLDDKELAKEPDFELDVNQHYLAFNPLNVNVFQRLEKTLGGETRYESDYEIGERIASVFVDTHDLTKLQRMALAAAIEDGMSIHDNLFSLDLMLDILESQAYMIVEEPNNEMSEKERIELGTLKSIQAGSMQAHRRIKSFVRANFFNNAATGSWADLFDKEELQIIQFDQVSGMAEKKAAIEFILRSIEIHIRMHGGEDGVFYPVIFPEIHNAMFGDESPMVKLLTELRSKGFILLGDTQGNAKLAANKLAPDMLNLGTSFELQFLPDNKDAETQSVVLASKDPSLDRFGWRQVLTTLNRGECVLMTDSGVDVVSVRSLKD